MTRSAPAETPDAMVFRRPGGRLRFAWKSFQFLLMIGCAAAFFSVGESGRPWLAAVAGLGIAGFALLHAYRSSTAQVLRVDRRGGVIDVTEEPPGGAARSRRVALSDVTGVTVEKRPDFERMRSYDVILRLAEPAEAIVVGTFRREIDAVAEAQRLDAALGLKRV